MKIIGIIPARYGSTRFPGKPLVDIAGKSMIQRVYEQALKAIKVVYVATDDNRIRDAVEKFGGKVIMTSMDNRSGTDRCAEAIRIISKITGVRYDIVVNIQGDEPFIQPKQIRIIIKCFEKKYTGIATLVKKIDNNEDLYDINKPKVIINKNNEAIYFSRFPLPYLRERENNNELDRHVFYKHIGMYAYRSGILKKIAKLEPSSLEKAESLEQLRWIENGYKISVEYTDIESISVDTKEDLVKINKFE